MPPLTRDEAKKYSAKIDPDWHFESDKKIFRQFIFKNFKEAMGFVDGVAAIAEEEGHHPDIQLSYNKLRLELTTHVIKGLSENDFIMAAKIDRIPLE